MLGLIKILETTNSPYNGEIQVVKTFEGAKIVVGGVSQSGFLVKKIWKTALNKIQKQSLTPKKILILGLGGGSVAQLASNFWKDADLVGIDIDPVMIELGRKYLGLSKIENLKFIKADAALWVKQNKQKNKARFDLVLIDLYKGAKVPKQFFTLEFLENVRALLSKNGIVAFNHLYSTSEKEEAESLERILRKVFSAITIVTPEANIIFLCYP